MIKKLKKEDLKELKKRIELINQHVLIIQSLEAEKQSFLANILPKYGCEMDKEYSINLKNGKITPIKNSKK